MKQLLYHIITCGVATLFLAACVRESDFSSSEIVSEGNNIILDLSSGLPTESRAVAATSAEVRVDHIDVLIFGEDGSKMHHERVSNCSDREGTIVLSAKRTAFGVNTKYWVYLVANSTEDATTFAADDFDRDELRTLIQTDPDIHMTGCLGLTNVPQSFLMDGIAYPEGESEPAPAASAPVVLNNGNKSDDTKLKVTLRRAAAKLTIQINKGQFVEFENNANSGYYLRNMPYSTSVMTGVGAEADLRTTSKSTGDYFKWERGSETSLYSRITVTAYAYAHAWENESALEKEVRLIVNIPMYCILHDEQGNYVDENGSITDTPVKVYHENSYYQIPVCRGTVLERNTCYEVVLTLNVPGGTDPLNPIKLEPINYSVRDWDEKNIQIGGEGDRPAYLTVNKEEMEMHNIEEDNTTLEFSSSSKVTVAIDRIYYIDKFGQEQELKPTGTDDEYGVNEGTDSNPSWKNKCTIHITPDKGINGKIDVYGTIPENNAVRYIVFTVTNETGQSRSVKVAQYPLEYITNVEGWYSYRDDFVSTASDGTSGVTTWLLLAGKSINKGTAYNTQQVTYNSTNAWICGCSWNNNSWSYSKTGTGFFGSKVAQVSSTTRLSTISYARWNESRSWWQTYTYTYNTTTTQISGLNNHRMYHVKINASSGDYTLGRPRLNASGYTDGGQDNAKLVSPSFMLASQLGAVMAMPALEGAAQHCKQYVEVAQNGTVYDDWRLPTKAEILIIYKFQNASDAMDEVLGGNRYWSASGLVDKPGVNSPTDQAIRCIRDAYDN